MSSEVEQSPTEALDTAGPKDEWTRRAPPYEIPTPGVPNHRRRVHSEWYWTVHDYSDYHCPDCGRGEGRARQFDVHHRDEDTANGAPENLIGLCHRCHMWRHNTGPTMSGLDVHEWKSEFEAIGGDPR